MELLNRIQNRYGACATQQALRLRTPQGEIPCLRLPEGMIRFNSKLGFWPHLKVLSDELANRWLVLQLSSFELAHGPGRDWAIPLAYEPADEDQAIRQQLGFDEGWEESEPETLLLFDEQWRDFFADVAQKGILGLTVEGAETSYPLRFQTWQLQELSESWSSR